VWFGPCVYSFHCNGPSVPTLILRRGRNGAIAAPGRSRLHQLVEQAVEVLHVEHEAGSHANRSQARADLAFEGAALDPEVVHCLGAVQPPPHDGLPAQRSRSSATRLPRHAPGRRCRTWWRAAANGRAVLRRARGHGCRQGAGRAAAHGRRRAAVVLIPVVDLLVPKAVRHHTELVLRNAEPADVKVTSGSSAAP
jgi:hypothetical protein